MPSESDKSQGAFRATLTSTSFIEKALLLFLTVLLSGAAVPLISRSLELRATARQKEIDEARIQRTALIEAQRTLFNEFSEVALTYQTLALDVSWYRTSEANDQRLYDRAFAKYSEKTPELVTTWRVLASRASVLGSPATAERMTELLTKVFQEQDTPISRLASKGGDMKKWEEQHRASERMLGIASQTVTDIAADMGLIRGAPAPADPSK